MSGTAQTKNLLSTTGSAERQGLIEGNKVITDLATIGIPISVNVTAVGNVGAGEDNLMTATLPADTLNAAGNGVIIEAWGTTANDADAKTLKVYFGSATVISQSLTASIAGRWFVRAHVLRTGSDAQDYSAVILESTATLAASKQAHEIGTLTQDEDAAITIKCTGEATDNNDIVQEGFVIYAIRAAGDLTAAQVKDIHGNVITS